MKQRVTYQWENQTIATLIVDGIEKNRGCGPWVFTNGMGASICGFSLYQLSRCAVEYSVVPLVRHPHCQNLSFVSTIWGCQNVTFTPHSFEV